MWYSIGVLKPDILIPACDEHWRPPLLSGGLSSPAVQKHGAGKRFGNRGLNLFRIHFSCSVVYEELLIKFKVIDFFFQKPQVESVRLFTSRSIGIVVCM